MVISHIAALTALPPASYFIPSKSSEDGQIYPVPSIFGRFLSVGRSTPPPSNAIHNGSMADQIPDSAALIAHISFLFWELIFGRPGWCRSTSNSNYRFLLWELIFGRSTPPSNSDSTDCCSNSSYFLPYSESSYLADQDVQITSSSSNSRFLLLRAHIWQTKCWQIYPQPSIKWQSFYSVHISDQLWTDLPPIKEISQIAALTLHISFSLWAHIWQTRSTPWVKWADLLPYLADHVLADLPPLNQFHRFLLWPHISFLFWDIWLRMGRSTPPIHQTATIDSYSESSYLADQDGRYLPPPLAISQIPALTAHIHCSLWELHIWQTKCWQI